jgi:four helix bundle protein
MFLQLNPTKMDVYSVARQLLVACYKVVLKFPPDERFNLTLQVKKAALSVLLNLAEGSSRKSVRDRCRFFEFSRSSAVEIDSAFDAASDLGYVQKEEMSEAGSLLIRVFQMLVKLVKTKERGDS